MNREQILQSAARNAARKAIPPTSWFDAGPAQRHCTPPTAPDPLRVAAIVILVLFFGFGFVMALCRGGAS